MTNTEKEKMNFLLAVHDGGMSTADIEEKYPFVNKRQVITAIKSGKLRAIRLGQGRGASPWMTTEDEVKKWIDESFVMNA